ncbi:ABC transporter permease subunit [Verrucomicrobiales bacterium]|jgi:phosphonate transport system permease protein|nr:ABC transporter permease subunit [Verrucomicrobiales bacterium]
MSDLATAESRIDELRRGRKRSPYLLISAAIVCAGIAWAWLGSGPLLGRLSAERRWSNFLNFLDRLVPTPVRKSGDWSDAFPWAWELFSNEGGIALLTTIAIATAAILLSGIMVLPVLSLASRQFSRRKPFGIWSGGAGKDTEFREKVIGPAMRFLFVVSRAIPEYLIAFLLLSLLGLQVWPLVLALAIHNFGILGRLGGEVVENAENGSREKNAAENALAIGRGRFATYVTTIVPQSFNRFLIYFFYRWETCIKDATVLGMLGLLTLGKLIALSKGFHWDRMFFFVLLGSSVILLGDLLSTFVRKKLR